MDPRRIFATIMTLVLACGAGVGASPLAARGVVDCSRIMPLGDSITLGVNGGYRNRLYARTSILGCGAGYVGTQFDQYAVAADKDHEGHPGFTISDIARDANAWFVAQAPDYVLLMIGTNDVAWWSVRSAEELADEHGALIEQIQTALPNAWIVVGSIPPIAPANLPPLDRDRAAFAHEFNAAVRTRVEARIAAGERIRYADIEARLTVADLYDGVHPTQLAHDKVADAWYAALEGILLTGGDRIFADDFQ